MTSTEFSQTQPPQVLTPNGEGGYTHTDAPPADEFAISPVWESRRDYKKPFKYTLPGSNQNLLLQHLDMPDLMKMGIANEVDFMTKALMDSPSDKEKTSEELAQEQLESAVKMGANFSKLEVMINKVCCAGILKPKVYEVPEHENARQKGLFYVDFIPWGERQDLFGVIFDSEGLTDFRQEQEPGVGDVADVQNVELPADTDTPSVRPENSEGILPQ